MDKRRKEEKMGLWYLAICLFCIMMVILLILNRHVESRKTVRKILVVFYICLAAVFFGLFIYNTVFHGKFLA